MNVKCVCAVILTVRVSQLQEKHFHTAERGMERHGHNSPGPPCTLSPEAKAPPPPSTDLRTPTMSARGTKVTHLATMEKNKTKKQQQPKKTKPTSSLKTGSPFTTV